jgi:hypothetical protein
LKTAFRFCTSDTGRQTETGSHEKPTVTRRIRDDKMDNSKEDAERRRCKQLDPELDAGENSAAVL